MTAGRVCCRCDLSITGEARRVPQESMSGARPDNWVHPTVAACKTALAAARERTS